MSEEWAISTDKKNDFKNVNIFLSIGLNICFGTQKNHLIEMVLLSSHNIYSKTCLKRPLKIKTKNGFQERLSLNAGQKYCRMLQESIVQYFRPSLSFYLLLRPLFCLNLSDRF